MNRRFFYIIRASGFASANQISIEPEALTGKTGMN